MLRFKHFSGRGEDLEAAINGWLGEFEPDVSQMTQTVSADGTVLISLLYEESFRGQELRLSAEHRMRNSPPPVPPEVAPDEPIIVTPDL